MKTIKFKQKMASLFKKIASLDFTKKKNGFCALLIGMVLALILGGLAYSFNWETAWIWWILTVGVIVGILNIFHEEGILFVLTLFTLTFMLHLLPSIAPFPAWITTLFGALVYLLASVAVIISLKVLYALALK